MDFFFPSEEYKIRRPEMSVTFATHDAALAAKKAGTPLGLCNGLDLLYNERSYDGRCKDSSGRDDDDGRGW